MDEELIYVSDEDIEINFYVDGEEYVVLKNYDKDLGNVYIAKVVSIDENCDTLVSVTEEEYEKAFEEYMSILEESLEDEVDEN